MFRNACLALALSLATTVPGYCAAPPGAQHGTIKDITIEVPSLATRQFPDAAKEEIRIYLPPGYDAGKSLRYPVLYLLHGFSTRSVLPDWTEVIQDSMDDFLSHYPQKKMIVVIPNGRNDASGSYWVDSSVGGKWESFVSNVLPPYVDLHFRTIPSARSRAIVGHSMGGFGALRIAMRHSDVFGVAYAISPCCLDFVKDLASSNAAWREVLAFRSMKDVTRAIKDNEFWPTALEALAIALTPDAGKPTLADLPYSIHDDKLVAEKSVIDRWKLQMPDDMVESHLEALKSLRGLGIEYGLEDPFTHIPAGANRLAILLASHDVPFNFETYHGDHNAGIPARMPTRILSFVAGKLEFGAHTTSNN